MGKAGQALRQVLEAYGISQSMLATALGVDRPIVHRWFHEQTDPTADTVARIVESLRSIHPDAGQLFVKEYLGDLTEESDAGSAFTTERLLPPFEDLNIPALAGLFSKSTTSYKYLFFLSLLDILRREKFQVSQGIEISEIFVEMLANAWYPHNYFKLSFGIPDRIAKRLDNLDLEISAPILQFKDVEKTLLRETIKKQDLRIIFRDLKENVPFRLIVPFLRQELQDNDVSLSRGNELSYQMPAIANKYFEIRKPLYKFDKNSYLEVERIIFHPEWLKYVQENYSVVRGWASWEWLVYMQQRNPNTLGIVNKIFMPQVRPGFPKSSYQRKYWASVMQSKTVKCIYSGSEIDSEKFDLDHYLPWSFVAHDQLWNLVPVISKVNSSKSNHLPAEKYFNKFVDLQHMSLLASRDIMSEKAWINSIESYISDLRLKPTDLLDKEVLERAYIATVKPLIILAAKQGFVSGWTYKA